MQLPKFLSPFFEGDSLKRLFQGLAVGIVGTIVVGFGWGGWHLASTVDEKVNDARKMATVAALSPICAEKFKTAAKADENLIADIKKVSSWRRDSYLKEAGWATFPGKAEPDDDVAQACANLLSNFIK